MAVGGAAINMYVPDIFQGTRANIVAMIIRKCDELVTKLRI